MPAGRPVEVRYRPGRNNSDLRMALYELWKRCCYACEEPLFFVDTEIDHVIPDATPPGELADLIRQHGLPEGFDLHGPANLAPICGPCNRRKSDRRLLHAYSTTLLLDITAQRAPAVMRWMHNRTTANNVALDLTRAATACLREPLARRAFVDSAPAVVQALALLDEGLAAGYLTTRHLNLAPDGLYVRVLLDARGRFALSIIEDICGSSLAAALEASIPHLRTALDQRIADHFRPPQGTADDPEVMTSPFNVSIRSLDASRHGTTVTVRLAGLGHGETEAAMTNADRPARAGDPARQRQCADVKVAFALHVRWDLHADTAHPDDATVQLHDVKFEEFEPYDIKGAQENADRQRPIQDPAPGVP